MDETKWWSERHIYHDDENQYILAFNGIAQSYFSYNTKLVNPDEIKSYWDFLNPKWKGKIVTLDPTMGRSVSGVLQFLYRNLELGPDFLRRFLSEMELTATRDLRQITDWLARGKFAIVGLAPADRVDIYEAREQGLPVDVFKGTNFKEGTPLSTSNGNLALINQAPHPNAAKMAINWFLSREGQMTFQRVGRDKESLRTDIPKDDVPAHLRRVKGAKYLVLAGSGFMNMKPINKVINEVWRGRKRKR